MDLSRKLIIPFSWEKRRPIFLERCLYIPGYYEKHSEWLALPWSHPAFFGNGSPVAIEYCSGNGEWIGKRAREEPNKNWVAVEKRFDRAQKIWKRIFREELSNLFVVCGEALLFSRFYASKGSVAEFFINFPDPWPKLRHAKHRLVHLEFLEAMALLAKPRAKATFVTDDPLYSERMLQMLSQSPFWSSLLPLPYFSTETSNYGTSFFDTLWREKGKEIRYSIWEKIL